MSKRESVSGDADLCPVCHEEIQIYAVGHCNHPICFRCSIRMRFLCEQMYCPICRSDIKQVAFLKKSIKFEMINLTSFCLDRRAMIFSEGEDLQDRYNELLKHRCVICDPPVEFDSFFKLKSHVSKEHNLMCCKLCTDNLKLFSHERKFYSTQDMVRHKKSGDPDDRSYKGHPICKFCDERHFDSDALILHLRKDHFYCHFCEADGRTGDFYCNYEDLKQHFREEHFLCEEGNCATAQWTNAFKLDIDLRAHMAQTHSKGLDKQQVRRLKTLELDFTQPGRKNHRRNERLTRDQRNREELQASQALSATLASVQRQGNIQVVKQGVVDMIRGQCQAPRIQNESVPTRFDFPDLDGRVDRLQPAQDIVDHNEPPVDRRPPEPQPSASSAAAATSDRFALRVGRGSSFMVANGDFPSLPSQSSLGRAGRGDPLPLRCRQVQSNNPWVKAEAKARETPQNKMEINQIKVKEADLIKAEVKEHPTDAGDLKRTIKPIPEEPVSEFPLLLKKTEHGKVKNSTKEPSPRSEKVKKEPAPKSNEAQKDLEEGKSTKPQSGGPTTNLPMLTSLRDLTKLYKGWSTEFPELTSTNGTTGKKAKAKEAIVSFSSDEVVKNLEEIKSSTSQSDPMSNLPAVTSLKDLTKLYEDWSVESSYQKATNGAAGKRAKVKEVVSASREAKKKEEDTVARAPKDPKPSKQNKSSKKQLRMSPTPVSEPPPHGKAAPLPAKHLERPKFVFPPLEPLSDQPSSLPPFNGHVLGPPPGFSVPKSVGPPPGFVSRAQAPPGFPLMSWACGSDSEDFPALERPLNRILKVTYSPVEGVPPGPWSSAVAPPEIPSLDAETPEQRLARLVLIERDHLVLESLRLLLLKLNQGVTEPEEFYSSCIQLLTSSVLAVTFRDIATCIRSPKDRAKVLALHQRQVSTY